MMKKFAIILDDGHGVRTLGKRSPLFEEDNCIGNTHFNEGDSFKENEFNSEVINRLEHILEIDHKVMQVAPQDDDVSLYERMELENIYYDMYNAKGHTCIFLSVHANAHEPLNPDTMQSELVWNDVAGIETYYYAKSKKGKLLASYIQNSTMKLGLKDRGIKPANFYVLRKSKSIALLYEGGFMTNKKEVALLASPGFQQKTAKYLAEGINDYFKFLNNI